MLKLKPNVLILLFIEYSRTHHPGMRLDTRERIDDVIPDPPFYTDTANQAFAWFKAGFVLGESMITNSTDEELDNFYQSPDSKEIQSK